MLYTSKGVCVGGGGCMHVYVHTCVYIHFSACACMCVSCASVFVGIPNYCVIHTCIRMYARIYIYVSTYNKIVICIQWIPCALHMNCVHTSVALPVAPGLLVYTTVLCVYVRMCVVGSCTTYCM